MCLPLCTHISAILPALWLSEISVEEARKTSKKAVVGDIVKLELNTKQFGRIAAQSAKHVIRQGIREAEKNQQVMEFQRRNQELVTAVITRVDPRSGAATIQVGKGETILPKAEQMRATTSWRAPTSRYTWWTSKRPKRACALWSPAPTPVW